MDLRGIANQVSDTVNPNVSVILRASSGYTIGAGLKQVPLYSDPVTGPAQIQALDNSDLKQLDGLNLQGSIRAIYLRGVLAGVITPDSKGGDLLTIPAPAVLPMQGTWLVTKVLESWPDWTKAAIVKQSTPFRSSSGTPYFGYSPNETPGVSGSNFTLAHTPNPSQALQLFVRAIGFGWILLEQGSDYTLTGSTISIINGQNYTAPNLRAWYPY